MLMQIEKILLLMKTNAWNRFKSSPLFKLVTIAIRNTNKASMKMARQSVGSNAAAPSSKGGR